MNKKETYEMPVYKLQLVRESTIVALPITQASDVVEMLEDIAVSDREQMIAVYVNTRHHPIGRHTVSIGTLNSAPCEAREVLKAALLVNAASVILSHNHPSCDVTPSKDDDAVTERIARACDLLKIRLLDHIILSPDGGFYSYQERKPELLKGGVS